MVDRDKFWHVGSLVMEASASSLLFIHNWFLRRACLVVHGVIPFFMRKVLVLLFVGFAWSAIAADSTNRLHFPANGFSINSLENGSAAPIQALIMSLSPRDQFAANVNVMIQPFPGTLDEFIELSDKQFKDAGFKLLLKRKVDASTILYEYAGEMQNRPLHWYARAVRAAGKIYVVTATGLEKHWSADGPKLKACVDSFQIDGGAQNSPR
jgi:hypothetical protein